MTALNDVRQNASAANIVWKISAAQVTNLGHPSWGKYWPFRPLFTFCSSKKCVIWSRQATSGLKARVGKFFWFQEWGFSCDCLGQDLVCHCMYQGCARHSFFLRDGASQKQRSAGRGRGRAKLHKSILLQISDKRFLANGNSSKKCIWFCVSFAATLFRAFPKSGVGRPFLHFTAIYLYLVQDERADVQFYEAVQNWWPMTYTGSTHVRLK